MYYRYGEVGGNFSDLGKLDREEGKGRKWGKEGRRQSVIADTLCQFKKFTSSNT